jgi:hypothetical protein
MLTNDDAKPLTWLPDEYLSVEWAVLRPEDTGLSSVVHVYAATEETTGLKGATTDFPLGPDGPAWSSVEYGDQAMYLRGVTKDDLVQYVACVAAAGNLHAGHLLCMGMLGVDTEDDLFLGEDRLWQAVSEVLPDWRRHVGTDDRGVARGHQTTEGEGPDNRLLFRWASADTRGRHREMRTITCREVDLSHSSDQSPHQTLTDSIQHHEAPISGAFSLPRIRNPDAVRCQKPENLQF